MGDWIEWMREKKEKGINNKCGGMIIRKLGKKKKNLKKRKCKERIVGKDKEGREEVIVKGLKWEMNNGLWVEEKERRKDLMRVKVEYNGRG